MRPRSKKTMAEKQPQQEGQKKNFLRNFLRVNDSGEFLVFLFFLFAAFIFWYLMTDLIIPQPLHQTVPSPLAGEG